MELFQTLSSHFRRVRQIRFDHMIRFDSAIFWRRHWTFWYTVSFRRRKRQALLIQNHQRPEYRQKRIFETAGTRYMQCQMHYRIRNFRLFPNFICTLLFYPNEDRLKFLFFLQENVICAVEAKQLQLDLNESGGTKKFDTMKRHASSHVKVQKLTD